MSAVTQEQARNMQDALICAYGSAAYKKGKISVTLQEGEWNLISFLLGRIANGELVELSESAAYVRSYEQTGLLADVDGAPLFSMQEG